MGTPFILYLVARTSSWLIGWWACYIDNDFPDRDLLSWRCNTLTVTNGQVSLKGSFLDFRDPSVLKNRVAEIKGVVDIKISAVFLD